MKPLIDIAKKSNTELICLTGLGGGSIYNRFYNIYVLNLVASKLNSGIEYLRSDHTKGSEEQEVIVASRFKTEEQKLLLGQNPEKSHATYGTSCKNTLNKCPESTGTFLRH